jgi:heptosyltransferase-2
MNATSSKHGSRRLIVRGVNWLGDAVMSSPALLRLREARPGDFIALLSPDKLADLWQNHPALDEVLTFTPSASALAIARRLRATRFDVGLVLPNSFRSALEFWVARVPERIGYAGQLRSWLLTQALARPGAVRMHKRSKREIVRLMASRPIQNLKPKIQNPTSAAHHIYQYLHLVEALGATAIPVAPQLFVTETEVQSFLQKFQVSPEPNRPLFGLNPGAEYGPAKRWPAEYFIAAAQQIQQRTHCRWLIFGAKGDRELAGRVAAGIQKAARNAGVTDNQSVINLAGATSLRELCAGLKACQVLLTNDTGPMHVAAAVGTAVVVPFGSTSPELTGPILEKDSRHKILQGHVPCAPCFLRECPIDFRCMQQITVADVVEATFAAAGH